MSPTPTDEDLTENLPTRHPANPVQEEGLSNSTMLEGVVGSTDTMQVFAQVECKELAHHADGGMGSVWRGQDASLRRKVAVKFLKENYKSDEAATQRFLFEGRVTSRLDHPGIVPVHAMGTTADGRPFYAMRFISGKSLAEAIRDYYAHTKESKKRRKEMAFRALLVHFVAACKTIAYAHSRGVIHCDIKPQNIMLGDFGETLVIDWGLALPGDRLEEERIVAPDTTIPAEELHAIAKRQGCSPPYMSPEQAQGLSLDRRTDIYSLGATLYQILTNDTQIARLSHIRDAVHRVVTGHIPRPRKLARDVPRALEEVCVKAMALSPADRYASALDLAADVERFLADERVTAYREPVYDRLRRWGRRHRGVMAVSVLSLLLLLFSFAAATVVLHNTAENERHATERSLALAAEFAARALEREIGARWLILETLANEPRLSELLENHQTAPVDADFQILSRMVAQWNDRFEHRYKSASWIIMDESGKLMARYPGAVYSDEQKERYAHRDYFHGNGHDLPEGQVGSPPHIAEPHVSIPFKSTISGEWMVSFTAPIFSQQSGPRKNFLGIVGMTIACGSFEGLKVNDPDLSIVLVREDSSEAEPSGVVLHHPSLRKSQRRTNPSLDEPRHIDPEQFAPLHAVRMSVLESNDHRMVREPHHVPQIAVSDRVLPGYIDPFFAGSAAQTAAFYPVFLEGSGEKEFDTRWFVIAHTRQ